MKSSFLFSAVIAMALLTSCGQDESQLVESNQKANLELFIQSATPSSRATAASVPADEGTINRVAIGVFKSDGSVDVIAEPTLTNKSCVIPCTSGSRTIVVVANAPQAYFAGVTKKTDFLSKTIALTQASNNLPMSGETAAAVTLVSGSTVSASVIISRLVSRVTLKSIKTAFDQAGQYNGASFSIDRIFMYNAKSTSTFEAIPTTTTLISGWDGSKVSVNSLIDQVSPAVAITSTPYATPFYYYTFANDLGTIANATKLVIGGQFKANSLATSETVYYPIVINKAQSGTTINGGASDGIKRNATYDLTATIKGKGTATPSEIIEPANLSLTVTVADWALNITQDVNFE